MVRVYITLFALLSHGPFKFSEHKKSGLNQI